MVARPPRLCFHSVEVLPEFVVWSKNPAGTWFQLLRFFAGELPATGPGGLWLQVDGCCSMASWVAGNTSLARGWQTFARGCGLGRRCNLHFKYDSNATLYVRVFGEDGLRFGVCPEDNDCGEVLSLGDGRDEGEGGLALGAGRGSSSYGGSSSSDSSSSSGYDQPPCRRAGFEAGCGSSHRRTPVKREEGSG